VVSGRLWKQGHISALFSLCAHFLYSACRMMEQSLHGEVMKTQDLPDVVVSVSKNPRGYKLAWDFLRANWHTMIKKSVNSSHMHLFHQGLIRPNPSSTKSPMNVQVMNRFCIFADSCFASQSTCRKITLCVCFDVTDLTLAPAPSHTW